MKTPPFFVEQLDKTGSCFVELLDKTAPCFVEINLAKGLTIVPQAVGLYIFKKAVLEDSNVV